MDQYLSDDAVARGPQARRVRLAQWSSLAALGISALALAVGVYQTRLLQVQARASVWPYVVIALDYAPDGDAAGFALHVQNNGVGPAVLRSTHVRLDGHDIAHWSELFEALMKHAHVDATLSGLASVVIPPSTNRDTDIIALRVRQADAARALYDARSRIALDICYCSIYEDCWIAHWQQPRPQPVAACEARAEEFNY